MKSVTIRIEESTHKKGKDKAKKKTRGNFSQYIEELILKDK